VSIVTGESRQLWMNHPQPKMCFKRIEVAVAMEQRVSMLDAEGRDEAIDGLADSYAPGSQPTVISCRGDS